MTKKKSTARDEARPSKSKEELDRLMKLYEKYESEGEKSPLPRPMDIWPGERPIGKIKVYHVKGGWRNEK